MTFPANYSVQYVQYSTRFTVQYSTVMYVHVHTVLTFNRELYERNGFDKQNKGIYLSTANTEYANVLLR